MFLCLEMRRFLVVKLASATHGKIHEAAVFCMPRREGSKNESDHPKAGFNGKSWLSEINHQSYLIRCLMMINDTSIFVASFAICLMMIPQYLLFHLLLAIHLDQL